MGDSTEIDHPVFCDFCRSLEVREPALYDARIRTGSAWAFMCQSHFDQYGPGQLGTGFGQRLERAER